MNHPVDLLVDLVDGSISARDRAVVDAHLATCARCRHDVRMAAAGREALGAMPVPAVPPGLGDAAIQEAEQRAREVTPKVAPLRRGGRAEVPAWYRWAGAAAAAAAVVLVVAVALPNVGDDADRGDRIEAVEDATVSAPVLATGLEVQDVDYDAAGLQELALSYASADARTGSGAVASGEVAPAARRAGFDEALACLRQAQPDLEARDPVRLIAARYEGIPAFVGVFLTGPGAGQPADAATVWVTDRRTCSRLLNTTRAEL